MNFLSEIELEIESCEIIATNRKLEIDWAVEISLSEIQDPEFLEDLADLMSKEVADEINQEILNEIRIGKRSKFRLITDDWEIQNKD